MEKSNMRALKLCCVCIYSITCSSGTSRGNNYKVIIPSWTCMRRSISTLVMSGALCDPSFPWELVVSPQHSFRDLIGSSVHLWLAWSYHTKDLHLQKTIPTANIWKPAMVCMLHSWVNSLVQCCMPNGAEHTTNTHSISNLPESCDFGQPVDSISLSITVSPADGV